jgi:hypothetical protein
VNVVSVEWCSGAPLSVSVSPTGRGIVQGSESSDFLDTKSKGIKSKVTLYRLNGMLRVTDGLREGSVREGQECLYCTGKLV